MPGPMYQLVVHIQYLRGYPPLINQLIAKRIYASWSEREPSILWLRKWGHDPNLKILYSNTILLLIFRATVFSSLDSCQSFGSPVTIPSGSSYLMRMLSGVSIYILPKDSRTGAKGHAHAGPSPRPSR